MIDTLLGKVAGFFEKDFLFASFLPALVFAPLMLVTFAAVLGSDTVRAAWLWVDSWTLMQKAILTALAGLAVVVFAYLLHALRRAFVGFWSGTSHFPLLWGFHKLGEAFNARQFRRLKKRSDVIPPWRDVDQFLIGEVRTRWNRGSKPLPRDKRDELMLVVSGLKSTMNPVGVRGELWKIIDSYTEYSGNELGEIYKAVRDKLDEWHKAAAISIQTQTAALDRRFGSLETIRATDLGNVIESYNQYSAKRYKIEAEIFWPRLRAVVKPEYYTLVEESRILLDFSLTTASLSLLYTLLALFVGPWLWYRPSLWLWLAAIAFSVSYFFYRLSVSAAYQLGEMIRSCFDLFRLDLMAALERPHPATFNIEQGQWEELSRLAVYGVAPDFVIKGRKSDA